MYFIDFLLTGNKPENNLWQKFKRKLGEEFQPNFELFAFQTYIDLLLSKGRMNCLDYNLPPSEEYMRKEMNQLNDILFRV